MVVAIAGKPIKRDTFALGTLAFSGTPEILSSKEG